MKTIGIIGGLGPEATVQYYHLLIKRFKEVFNTDHQPNIVINSVDMKEMVELVANRDFPALVNFLLKAIRLYEQAGISIVGISSNTPHMVFDELQAATPVKLVSIVESTCRTAQGLGLKKVGLIGTRLTMTGGFYQKTASKFGIDVISPAEDNQVFIHDIYLNELVNNIIRQETKTRLVEICRSLASQFDLQGIILGGTELPLIIDESDFPDMQILNTTKIHIDSILHELR